MKLSRCLTFSDVGNLAIAVTRSFDGFIPSAEIKCPRYVTCCRKNSHLPRHCFIPYSFSAATTCLRCCRCSSFVRPVTITSSRYAITYGMPETRLSTNVWKIAGTGAGPNDNRLYRNSIVCVFTTSSFFVASSSATCQYASVISRFEKFCPPCSLANSCLPSEWGVGVHVA